MFVIPLTDYVNVALILITDSCTIAGCYSTFLHKDDLLVHQRVHKPAGDSSKAELITCDICQKVLPSKSKLRRHKLFHIGEKHFRCPIKVSLTVKRMLLIKEKESRLL